MMVPLELTRLTRACGPTAWRACTGPLWPASYPQSGILPLPPFAPTQPSTKGEQDFEKALHQAVRRGVIVVAAPGNQGALGGSAITRPPWVISMVACDLRGRLIRSHPNCHRTRTG